MANTFGTSTQSFALRHKYFQSNLQFALKKAMVSEAICTVDRSEQKTVQNPYVTEVAAAIQAVAGTYSPATRTTTDDALSVDDEVVVSTHVFDFEMRTANFDLTANLLDDLIYQVAWKTDQFVLNKILDSATGAYTTPAGGFTTASNIAVICSNLLSKVAGYATGVASSPFLVIESTDIVGFAQAQVASGYSYADAALNNGFMSNYMGIKIYVVRTGTFVTTTLGTLTATNSGHRLFGISKLALFASPRGVQYEEKGITSKTGKEVAAYGYVGAKVWTPHAGLFVDITLA
jgi:hypothetical protein